MSAEHPYAGRPIKVGNDWIVIRFKERETPDLKQFESEEGQTWEQMFRYRKAGEGYRRWLAALRERSKIEIIRDVAGL